MRPIFSAFPTLALPWENLGVFPTPLEALDDVVPGGRAFIKRDDLTSPIYGGNKVRTLETLFGQAKAEGATHIYSTGAFGSNHATATVLHAARAGLRPGVAVFPQPKSATAAANLKTMLTHRPELVALRHWSLLPVGIGIAHRRHRDDERAFVMVPGGATPRGGLGYVSAALELAEQLAQRAGPEPSAIAIGVGSTCTSAGLLYGLWLARKLGHFPKGAPALVSVRVTPWPITSPVRIVRLAVAIGRSLAAAVGDDSLEPTYRALRANLRVDGRALGRGYGKPTRAGREAIERFAAHPGLRLDTTYSAKAAVGFLRCLEEVEGPVIFWSTKSSVELPVGDAGIEWAPGFVQEWLRRAEQRP
ncbi:MAG: pyridoxal-phosphate dependent enzyme [Myxococcota bacterium]